MESRRYGYLFILDSIKLNKENNMPISSISLTPEQLQTPDGVKALNEALEKLSNLVPGDGEDVRVLNGFGTPEAQIKASIGSIYMRKDGSTGTSVYMKESGTGATGWATISVSTIENRTSDPVSPETGQIWFRTDL